MLTYFRLHRLRRAAEQVEELDRIERARARAAIKINGMIMLGCLCILSSLFCGGALFEC